MTESRRRDSDLSELRYERLSRLVQQYELGVLSHEAFQRLKREVLLDHSAPDKPRRAPLELLIATYTSLSKLESSLPVLRALGTEHPAGIIDGATVYRDRLGTNRVRPIRGLTRESFPSVIISLCGLLFSPDSVECNPNDEGSQESLRALCRQGMEDPVLRSLGSALPIGSTSVLVVYTSSVADIVAGVFHGFDSFARRILSDEITEVLGDFSMPD